MNKSRLLIIDTGVQKHYTPLSTINRKRQHDDWKKSVIQN